MIHWRRGLNNNIKIWSKGSSPQKNCNGVGLGKEALIHLAQPYEQKTRQWRVFHIATFMHCNVSPEIQIRYINLMIKKTKTIENRPLSLTMSYCIVLAFVQFWHRLPSVQQINNVRFCFFSWLWVKEARKASVEFFYCANTKYTSPTHLGTNSDTHTENN